jgi:hypothetical protein
VLTKNEEYLEQLLHVDGGKNKMIAALEETPLWTDDYYDIVGALL